MPNPPNETKPQATCPSCKGTQLVEAGPITEGQARVRCLNCNTTFTAPEATRRKLMG
jgi:predicted Zn finger-like uncharacterized protein